MNCTLQNPEPRVLLQSAFFLASKHGMPSLRPSSERQSEHSTSLLEYFIAMYMTTGCHILVRFCRPKEKQNRKLTETQDRCAALDVILLETHGSQTPNGRADLELVTVMVPYNVLIAPEDIWRMEESLV